MAEKNTPPIFYSQTGHRWRAFKGGIRIFSVLALLVIVAVFLTVFQQSKEKLPRLTNQNEAFKQVLDPKHLLVLSTQGNNEYQQLHTRFEEATELIKLRLPHASESDRGISPKIRAGFYINWDPQSQSSLRKNIDKLDMVMPEWYTWQVNSDTLYSSIDTAALALMQQHNIKIVPIINNYFTDHWDTVETPRLLSSPKTRNQLIRSILQQLRYYDFAGVNIDIENLPPSATKNYIAFQRELYAVLHPEGYLVTQDIPLSNNDESLKQLATYNDYLIIMGYDMHWEGSAPGPIVSLEWVENALDKICKVIPSQKCILGIPAYGYDWATGKTGTDVSYEEAMTIATESDGKIQFDTTFNCFFSYYDDNNNTHDVWFADAVTCFNLLRTAADFDLSGIALWRLGGEDQRIWSFYSKDMRCENRQSSLTSILPAGTELTRIPSTGQIDFIGEGEILDEVAIPGDGVASLDIDTSECLIVGETYEKLPSTYLIKRFGKTNKKVVLSFDDGPSSDYTPAILDILNAKQVPATFFVIGVNAENNLNTLRKIYNKGYEIGNHTFSHPNLATVSSERTMLELNATRRIIECATGHSTILFRPPYNADSEPQTKDEIIPVVEARKYSYYTIGESIDPCDWEKGITADTIVARVIAQTSNGNTILLHDGGGDRSATVAALPRIIDYYKNKGYTFTTVANLIGKTRNDVMPVIASHRDLIKTHVNWAIASSIFWGERILFSLFFLSIILSVGRTITIAIIAAIQKRKQDHETIIPFQNIPLVSVIVPAYNEEITVTKTIENLLQSDYPSLEIVFVDDGSKDSTFQAVADAFPNNNRIRSLTKVNGGKASALNFGIGHASGQFLVCIDADTQLLPDAISKLMAYFTDDNVVAVAGNVKVGNEHTMLTHWQAIEYITSQNFDRRAYDLLNAIIVVPGAIGAFRKQSVIDVGLFTTDTLAEDCDLTIRLLKAGKKIRYCNTAIALTEAPETLKMFLKQRFRWSFGILQCIWKHRETFFDRKFGSLGIVALPNSLLFQFMLPLLAPFADIYMLLSFATGNWRQVIIYYLIFTAVDALAAIIAFSFEKESKVRLLWILPQRIAYRVLIYYILIKSILAAVKGSLVGWGVLKRTGNVKIQTAQDQQ
jgi:cellulose synthase/poly-beta-1,6-N-acetylglucosamine synthase-like glycosyltransferase/spore germination protein YaaH/peptidoglycan/xylan/chitin deacetylase (PgdA/CDA1 family)